MASHDYVRTSLDIPIEEHRKLKAMAAFRGISMKALILECLNIEIYSNNVPNEETERTLRESDQNKNIMHCKDFDDFRSQLGL